MENIIKKIEELKEIEENKLKLFEPYTSNKLTIESKEQTIGKIKAYNKCINLIDDVDLNQLSDGYHTFEELYFHRMILFSVICKQNKDKSWRSKLHNDGTMFKDYFIVGVETEKGQYTYHYHINHFHHFAGVKILDKAPAWDGHISDDVIRLKDLKMIEISNIFTNLECKLNNECKKVYIVSYYDGRIKKVFYKSENAERYAKDDLSLDVFEFDIDDLKESDKNVKNG